MKKLIFLFFVLLILLTYKSSSTYVFEEIESNIYDNYTLKFDNCILNSTNFLDNFNFFNNKDFKILEITPDINYGKKYYYYSSNLNMVINEFKSDYINNLIDNSKYSNEVCIHKVRINSCISDIKNFKNIISFEY